MLLLEWLQTPLHWWSPCLWSLPPCRWSPGFWELSVQHLWLCPHAAGEQQVQEHSEEGPAGPHLLRHPVHADHRGAGEELGGTLVSSDLCSVWTNVLPNAPTDQGVDGEPTTIRGGRGRWYFLLLGQDLGPGSADGEIQTKDSQSGPELLRTKWPESMQTVSN